MQSLQSVSETVSKHETVVLYFAAPSCQVCHALKPKLLGAIRSEFPGFVLESVDCEATPDIPAQYSVFTVPAVLVFIGGKEILRRSRHISMADVIESIRRPYDIWRAMRNQ